MSKSRLNLTVCIATAILSMILWNCSDDSPTGPGKNAEIRFPLAVGNEWVYRCTYSRVSESASDTTRESSTGEIAWKVVAFEEVLGQEACRMEVAQKVTSGPDSGQVVTFNNWYAERDSLLVAVASESASGHAPFSPGQLYKPATSRSEVNGWGVTVLWYPLAPGAEWSFSNYLKTDIKKAEVREPVTVNGRKYNTVRVVRNLDTTGDPEALTPFVLNTTQWFAVEGLVRGASVSTVYTDTMTVCETFTQELITYMLK